MLIFWYTGGDGVSLNFPGGVLYAAASPICAGI